MTSRDFLLLSPIRQFRLAFLTFLPVFLFAPLAGWQSAHCTSCKRDKNKPRTGRSTGYTLRGCSGNGKNAAARNNACVPGLFFCCLFSPNSSGYISLALLEKKKKELQRSARRALPQSATKGKNKNKTNCTALSDELANRHKSPRKPPRIQTTTSPALIHFNLKFIDTSKAGL